MLAPALFVLPDGRQVAPFQVAPWFSEPIAQELQGLMPRLRGEWPCLPFGFDIDRPGFDEWPASRAADAIDEGHGFAANNDWTLSDASSRRALALHRLSADASDRSHGAAHNSRPSRPR